MLYVYLEQTKTWLCFVCKIRRVRETTRRDALRINENRFRHAAGTMSPSAVQTGVCKNKP